MNAIAEPIALDEFVRLVKSKELLPHHQLACMARRMTREEFAALCLSIESGGLVNAIITHQGQILDGRERQDACYRTRTPMRIRQWGGECGSPEAFVLAALQRKHLAPQEKAMAAAKIKEWIEQERKQISVSADTEIARPKPGRPSQGGRSRDQAAQAAGTSPAQTARAARVRKKGIPELVQAVEEGTLSVERGAKLAGESPEEQLRQMQAADQEEEAGDDPAKLLDQFARWFRRGRRLAKKLFVLSEGGREEEMRTWFEKGLKACESAVESVANHVGKGKPAA